MADSIIYFGEMQGLSCIFWGAPGSAKSRSVKAAARKRGAYLIDIRLGQYDSVDLRGIPDKDDTGHTVWYPASTLPFKGNPRFAHLADVPIYLFFDEMTMANQAVFGISYQLTDERRCGEHELMDNVVVIAASNREGDRSISNRMPLALCNRMLHFNVILTWQAWCNDFARTSGYASAPYAIGLLNFKSDLFDKFDPSSPNKVFPTARTWEYALKIDSDPNIPDDFKEIGVAGALGVGPVYVSQIEGDRYKPSKTLMQLIKMYDRHGLPEEEAPPSTRPVPQP
jgi:MoxR-like ATPase